jgi:hypothetical protein
VQAVAAALAAAEVAVAAAVHHPQPRQELLLQLLQPGQHGLL